jgi:hypothetical protein
MPFRVRLDTPIQVDLDNPVDFWLQRREKRLTVVVAFLRVGSN